MFGDKLEFEQQKWLLDPGFDVHVSQLCLQSLYIVALDGQVETLLILANTEVPNSSRTEESSSHCSWDALFAPTK